MKLARNLKNHVAKMLSYLSTFMYALFQLIACF